VRHSCADSVVLGPFLTNLFSCTCTPNELLFCPDDVSGTFFRRSSRLTFVLVRPRRIFLLPFFFRPATKVNGYMLSSVGCVKHGASPYASVSLSVGFLAAFSPFPFFLESLWRAGPAGFGNGRCFGQTPPPIFTLPMRRIFDIARVLVPSRFAARMMVSRP